MPGGDDDADDVIVLDSASDRESNGAVDDSDDEVLFEGTFAIGDKKKKKNKNNKSQHTRFVSESSSGNEGEQRRSPNGRERNIEEEDDVNFMIDTGNAVPKFSEDDSVILDTSSAERSDHEWPDAPDGDRISLNFVLTTDESIASLKEDKKPKRRGVECFNCGGPHILGKCPEPRDQARISRAMREQRMNRNPDPGRYHDANDADLASRFRAGIISPDLAEALGLRRNELPEWIYRMRKLGFIRGYPPGYLKQAIVSEREAPDAILQFHFDQPDGESHEADDSADCASRIDPKKIFYYYGFNKAARDGTRDREASWYTVPPFEAFVDMHQNELDRQHERAQRTKRHKRQHEDDDRNGPSPSKKLKRDPNVVDMDVSSDDEPSTSDCLLPPPPLPPTEYDSLTEEELEELLAEKQREMAEMEEIGSPEAEENSKEATEVPVVIPTGEDEGGERVVTPPTVERRIARHASSRSLDVMIGTPLGAPPLSHSKPSLDDFSKGIVPFSVNEEPPVAHKGFFKRIMAKLKGVANKAKSSPKHPGDRSRPDKHQANRQRKKKH